jgi:hypothetical protein
MFLYRSDCDDFNMFRSLGNADDLGSIWRIRNWSVSKQRENSKAVKETVVFRFEHSVSPMGLQTVQAKYFGDLFRE